ncbi:MAG: hypothetical protein AAFY56_17835 [Pseudomonadota bacterium]
MNRHNAMRTPPAKMVRDLDTAEQFLIWALRRRHFDGEPPSDQLVQGFFLAFGLTYIERALASFETIIRVLDEFGDRPSIPVTHCQPRLTADEAALLLLFAHPRNYPATEPAINTCHMLRGDGWAALANALNDFARLMVACDLAQRVSLSTASMPRAKPINLN